MNRRRLGKHKDAIFQAIYGMMDGVPFVIDNPSVKECKMIKRDGNLYLSCRLNLPGPVIQAGESTQFLFSVFE